MSQILFNPGNREQLIDCLNDVDAYIIGVQNLSVNFFALDIDEIIELMENNDKNIYLALNKNISNSDLPLLEQTLIRIKDYPIKGLFYADVSLIPILKRLDIKIPLIWSNEHLTTNYHTMNYWYKFNTLKTFISNEITLDEIIAILDNYNGDSIVQVFGYLPMYVSKRHAIKNYLNYFNLTSSSKCFKLEKENKQYPIIDNDNGTCIFSSNILCDFSGYQKLCDHGLALALISGYEIDNDIIKTVIKDFKKVDNKNATIMQKEINSLISNIDSGFWYRKTVYKVKKNEK